MNDGADQAAGIYDLRFALFDAFLGITEWNCKTDGDTLRQIGPMAQDFCAPFKVGPDDKRISMVDVDGVALAAVQGLNQKLDSENANHNGAFVWADDQPVFFASSSANQFLIRATGGVGIGKSF